VAWEMKFFIKLMIVTLLVCVSAQAIGKINILDANTTTYKHMLIVLSKQKHSNSQTQLQILLLKTLLNLKQPAVKDIQKTYNIISSKQYADLFAQYLNILEKKIQDKARANALYFATAICLLCKNIKK